jgi:hypothetical protein
MARPGTGAAARGAPAPLAGERQRPARYVEIIREPAISSARVLATWWVAALLTLGCAGPQPPPAAPSAATRPAPAVKTQTARQQLLAELGKLDTPDVLAQLPSDLRGALADRISGVSPEERQALGTAEWARHRPVLHLLVGGQESEALYQIVVGGAAAELVETSLAMGNEELQGLAEPITNLTRAAAARWLFERRLDVATPSGATPELCERIDRAAEALGRFDLQLLARRTAVESDPTPARRLAVARALAAELDADAAQALIDRVRREHDQTETKDPQLRRALDAAQKLADRARVAIGDEKVDTLASTVERARALLDLDRPAPALELLEPHRGKASEHLALATTLALADLGGTACPGLPSTNPHLIACAAAWRENAAVARSLPLLDQAWQSRRGRDDRSIEAYLGLRHVMPWLYATMGRVDADPEELMKQSSQRVARLRAAVEETAGERQRFAGLVLFVDLLGAGLEAAGAREPGERVRLADERQAELVEQARTLAARLPEEPHTQAAVLGVVAMLAQDRDGAELLAALPEQLAPRHREARWALDVWNAVAHDRPAIAERARRTLMELLDEQDPGLDRAKVVLTMAEADAVLGGTPKDYGNLLRVVDRLSQGPLPRELALRVTIDRAGVLHRQALLPEAIEVLATANEDDIPPGTAAELDLAVIARAYLVYLRGLHSEGDERIEYADKLRSFTDELGGQVSVGAVLAHALWLRELDYQIALAKCERFGCNRPYLERQRAGSQKEIVKLVGPESASVVRRGVLPLGAVTASFTFSPRDGLQPRVALDPILLAAPLPETK